jgi:uncharacterized protein (DUF58 family)
VLVAILILLLLAAAAGVLGAVLKAVFVLVLAVILAIVILVAGSFYYLRYRVRRFMQGSDPQPRTFPQRPTRDAYPAEGYKRPRGRDPELPQ